MSYVTVCYEVVGPAKHRIRRMVSVHRYSRVKYINVTFIIVYVELLANNVVERM